MPIQYCLKIVLSFKHKRLKSLKDLRLQSLKYFLCCPGSLTVSRDELPLASVATQPLWHPTSSNVSVLYFMHKMGRGAVSFGGFISIFSLLFSQENLCKMVQKTERQNETLTMGNMVLKKIAISNLYEQPNSTLFT